MPVKKNWDWYEVEDVLNTKFRNGILHYGIKYVNNKRIYWTPYWDVNYTCREWY